MKRATVTALVVVQVVFAFALLRVGFLVVDLGGQLAVANRQLATAKADRDRMQDRIDALEQALLALGVDPNTIPARPKSPRAGPSTPATATAGKPRPGAQPTPPRPSPTSTAPAPRRTPSPRPSPSPCLVPNPLDGCLLPAPA